MSSIYRLLFIVIILSSVFGDDTLSVEPIEKYYFEKSYFQMFLHDSLTLHSAYYRPNPMKAFYGSHVMPNVLVKGMLSANIVSDISLRLDGRFRLNINKNIFYVWNFRIADSPELLPGYRGVKRESVGNVRADMSYSALNARTDHVVLSLNRGQIETSNFGENLLINANNNITDNVLLSFNNKSISIDNIIVFLKSEYEKKRVIIYHRYGYKRQNLSLGFSELSLLAYSNNSMTSLEKYFMPYSFLYEVEANSANTSNIMWRFDFSYYWTRSIIWGELLIDDYALDHLSPPKVGILLGLRKELFSLPFILRYTKINRWVYNYGYDAKELRFVEQELPLGNIIGPDAMKVELSSHFHSTRSKIMFDFIPSISLIAKGEGDIFEDTPVPSGENFGYFKQKYLTGDVDYSLNYESLMMLRYDNYKLKIIIYSQNDEHVFRVIFSYSITG
jgi:hypothetical protein